jgi:hypothetical protein
MQPAAQIPPTAAPDLIQRLEMILAALESGRAYEAAFQLEKWLKSIRPKQPRRDYSKGPDYDKVVLICEARRCASNAR